MESPMTAADVGAVIGNRDGGWAGGEWIFGLIVLAAMFNGRFGNWGGNGGRGEALTTAESCNMNSFNELKGQVGRMNDMMFSNARQQDNAICNAEYTNLQNFNATQRQLADCCCKLENAIHAEGEATRNMMQQDKIEALQHEVSDLKTQQMFCGVPRIPTSFTYAVNPGSLLGNGCCNQRCGNTLF